MITQQTVAWALYDFADTAFSALFISFFYPILIKTYLGGNEFQIGLSLGLSLLVAALIVPLIGALSDATGKKIPILLVTTAITAGLIAATSFAGLYGALFLGFLANLFNVVDTDLYDSQLVEITREENRGRISGFGAAVGYGGTIASLAMGYLVMSRIGWEKKEAVQAIFQAVAVFYLVFSIPLFLVLKDAASKEISFRESLQKALAEIKYTLTKMREMPGLGNFLIGSFIYNNGLNTIIVFLGLYATTVIGLTLQAFFFVFAALALGSIAGSLLAGLLSDKIGPKKMLIGTLAVWILDTIYFLNLDAAIRFLKPASQTRTALSINEWFLSVFQIEHFINPPLLAFLVGGMIGGAGLGAVCVGNRHLLSRLAPRHKVAEIFGFMGLSKKFSGVAGSVLFGLIVTHFGGYSHAILLILLFFLVGLFFLFRVPSP
jgi:UMF1 family MFS transporter